MLKLQFQVTELQVVSCSVKQSNTTYLIELPVRKRPDTQEPLSKCGILTQTYVAVLLQYEERAREKQITSLYNK